MNANPNLTVYCGPMWGGKSTRLLADLERATLQRKRCVVFKPAIDDRYGTDDIVSHSGWRHPAVSVRSGADVVGALAAMVSGMSIALYYILSNYHGVQKYFGLVPEQTLWLGLEPFSAGVFGVPVGLLCGVVGSWLWPGRGKAPEPVTL